MRRLWSVVLAIGVAVPAFAQVVTTESPLYPDVPPRAALIQISSPDASGNVTVTGAAGAVAPRSTVVLVNMETSDQSLATAAADGSFRADFFGPVGSSILVKADPTGRFRIQDGPLSLLKLTGTILRVPEQPATDSVLFNTAGYFEPGGDKWGPGWTFQGTITGQRFQPADTIRLRGTLRMVSPLLVDTDSVRVQVQFNVDRLSGPDGSGSYPRGGFASTILTPTGIPIELGQPERVRAGGLLPATRVVGGRLEQPLDLSLQLPADLPAGFFRPFLFVGFFSLTARPDTTRAISTEFREGSYGPIITVGNPAPPRIPWMLLVDTFSNGTRGVRAIEDRDRFGLAQRILTQSETFIVPRTDPATGQPITFRLEPFAPTISNGDRGGSPLPPVIPFRFPSGSLTVRIQKPDGSTQVIGPAPFVQSRMRGVLAQNGEDFQDTGGRIEDCYQLSTMDPRFGVQFSQDGKYVISVDGSIDDIWGNTWQGGGTYEIYVARLLSLDTAVLPGAPFEVGDFLNPGLVVTPPMPATVDVRFQLAPNSDASRMVMQNAQGLANRFGYFHPADGISLDQPGEYRVDVTASYQDDQGNLWMGARTWASVVAPRNSSIVAHGARGMNSQSTIGPQWFFSKDIPGGDHIHFPFNSGDINWGRKSDGPFSTGTQPMLTFQDPSGSISNLLLSRSSPKTRWPLSQRAAAGQMMLFSTRPDNNEVLLDPSKADVWGYFYTAVERPLVRVREEIGEETGRGPYWRFDRQYGGQLGVGVNGDLPNHFKFMYGAAVLRGSAFAQPLYAIYGSLWVLIPENDSRGSRVFPPFQGNGGGPTGGPVMTLKGRDIELFLHLTGVRPGSVLEVGDTFGLTGEVAPPLPALVSYTVTSPGGQRRSFSNRASRIGYYYQPKDDFTIDEAGMYTVDLNVSYDGQTSAGQLTQPFPSGDILGSDRGRFFFYAVRRNSLPLVVTLPRQSTVSSAQVNVTASAPAGVTLNSAHFTTTVPGFLLETSALTPGAGTVSYRFDPVALARTFPNLSVNPLVDVVTITVFATGTDANRNPTYAAKVLALHGAELFNLPIPTPTNIQTFTVVPRGGSSITSAGESRATTTGYARIQPNTGSATPSGTAIFGFRQNNVLVSETGVPASVPVTSGRIYAEVGGAVDTGIAIANTNSSTATLNFFFTDATGRDLGSGTTTIPANGQVAKFLDQAPYNLAAPFQGTFSFTSSMPVAVIALRGLTNERGEFLMSTLPVIDTTSPNSGVQVLPDYADGGGWTTQILLVNPTSGSLTGNVQFLGSDGTPANVTIDGQTGNSFAYSIASRSSQKLVTSGTAAITGAGSVRVVPIGATAPTPLILFSFKQGGVTVSEAGVPVTAATALRMYVESSGTSGQSGNIQSGVAVANNSSSSAVITFEVTQLDGTSVPGLSPASVSLAGAGQIAKFLADIFPSLPNPFKGVLRISTTSAGISVVGLRTRYNERGDFLLTTTPPTIETAPSPTTEMVFPQLADGGGYTTQFILFSGTSGQSGSGSLRLYDASGQPLILTLR
jgi:hypothetical protein